MGNKSILSKTLAIIGTIMVWLPILAPFFFGLLSLIGEGLFRFDYLMPAEFFPLVLVGGGVLVWAALRARSRRRLIGWGLGIAFLSLVGAQLLAVVTGLASGETEVGGWQWALVLALLALYALAVATVGVAGVLLLRDLFRPTRPRFEN